MLAIRLFDVISPTVEPHSLLSTPSFIVVLRVWSEHLFATSPILPHPGLPALRAVLEQRYPAVHHAWTDTLCIDQESEEDKMQQIPLMRNIYAGTVAVAVVPGGVLGIEQGRVDALAERLQPC